MTSLLIVGHQYSDYQFVETLLYAHGMGKANNSRREELTPVAVMQKLLKAQNIVFDHNVNIFQVEPSGVWNELALDLLLGNIDQAFWGWADPQVILTLDYWRKIEPQLKFLLVYDTPEMIFASIFKNKPITQKKLEQEIEHWNVFFEELLQFYRQNKESCLLVHVGLIKENFSSFFKLVSNMTGYPFGDFSVETVVVENEVNKADLLLMREILKKFSDIHFSYEKLQDKADLPLTISEIPYVDNVVLAWNAKQEIKNTEIRVGKFTQSEGLKEENELLLLQLYQVQEELECCFLENQKLTRGGKCLYDQSVSFKNKEYAENHSYYGAGDRIKQELAYRLGATMIRQSQTITGWFTMPWVLLRETKECHKDLNKKKAKNFPPISAYQDYYEVEQVKQHLSYRLGHTVITNIGSVVGCIKLPWLLRKEVVDFQKKN